MYSCGKMLCIYCKSVKRLEKHSKSVERKENLLFSDIIVDN